jgi:hypothetical protein
MKINTDNIVTNINTNKGIISHLGLIAFSLIALFATPFITVVAWGTLAYGLYAAYIEWGEM